MKKLLFLIMTMLILIFAISVKLLTVKTYSNEDVSNLILKGVENLDNMNNVSFEVQNNYAISKHYYKGNKYKATVLEDFRGASKSTTISILDEGKRYVFSDKSINVEKIIGVYKITGFYKGIQFELAENIKEHVNAKREYEYIRDEKIEGKDCIFVKEIFFARRDNNWIDYNKTYPGEDIPVYWIEKSTGFVIAAAKMKYGKKSASPEAIIRNITFGNVVDSDFEIPTGCRMIE